MDEKNTILIVEDEEINRGLLKHILKEDYEVIEAENGKAALDILKSKTSISAIILDLVMPIMDGWEFLKIYKDDELKSIPLIVSTGSSDDDTECRCLEYGAWDFIRKPYNRDIIKFRIRNVIERSELYVYKELRYREQYDNLTGIYKREKFFKETSKMIENKNDIKFVFIRLDIHKFQLINQFFGFKKGDAFIKYISQWFKIAEEKKHLKYLTYGHIEADVFCCCIEYENQEKVINFINDMSSYIKNFGIAFDILPVFGLYIVYDTSENIDQIYDKTNLASKQCKGNYITNYEFYNDEINDRIVKEQIINNEMTKALQEEQFVLYLQPKYELRHEKIAGAEVLVRWLHPEKGMVSPGEFIPVFEKNGFINNLDYYVWEHTCMLIRKWLDEGKKPYPVSVNISRVSVYNPELVNIIVGLVNKYNVPAEYIQFELTESAYTNNSDSIREDMTKLQNYGFKILMDDFGSGYSSLNVLKDIPVDILKIDMKFMSDTSNTGRGENILASVVRMSKWLGMPVVAEGVEKKKQVEFLKSVGCEYIQGYYYSKPIPVEEYEKKAFVENGYYHNENFEHTNSDYLWKDDSQLGMLFTDYNQAVVICEYENGVIDIIRANNAYYNIFGYDDINNVDGTLNEIDNEQQRKKVLDAFAKTSKTQGTVECEYDRELNEHSHNTFRLKLKFMKKIGSKSIIMGIIEDITEQRRLDNELNRYRSAIMSVDRQEKNILIVDDAEIDREELKCMFEDNYKILEAENGKEAFEIINKNNYAIDIILLDMMMPVMDGKQFLELKKKNKVLDDIPVIIITADNAKKLQSETIEMGAYDYIIKPFVPEVIVKRIENVIKSTRTIGKYLSDYKEVCKIDEIQ